MDDKDIVITSAFRTPIGSLLGSLTDHSATQLGTEVIKKCIQDSKLKSDEIDKKKSELKKDFIGKYKFNFDNFISLSLTNIFDSFNLIIRLSLFGFKCIFVLLKSTFICSCVSFAFCLIKVLNLLVSIPK